MTKTWDKLGQEAYKLAKDLYDTMVMKGEHISEENRRRMEELSKLHQPTVIKNEVAVCDKCLGRGSIVIYDTCLDCDKCEGTGTNS
mgnify:FL=1